MNARPNNTGKSNKGNQPRPVARPSGNDRRPLKASLGELAHSARVVRWERPACKVCMRPIDLRRQPHGWMHLSCEDVPTVPATINEITEEGGQS